MTCLIFPLGFYGNGIINSILTGAQPAFAAKEMKRFSFSREPGRQNVKPIPAQTDVSIFQAPFLFYQSKPIL